VSIPAKNFTWTLTKCITEDGSTQIKSNTVTIYDIVNGADSATAECTVTHNSVKLKKVFSITKAKQGNSSYTLDIVNDFVSVTTGSNGIIS
jgi:hypothetical protein